MVPRSNASTCLPFQMAFPVQPPPLATAYAVALAAERARSEPPAGYRLYWMATGRFGSCDVPVDPISFIVVGRHGFCDVVLDGDPSIALRHLLVRATRLDDGCPRLSVLDLHTSLGFELPDGRNEHSMAATGPIAFHVGGYALIAFPGGEPLPDALPEPVCTRGLVAHPYRDAPLSRVTLMPSALQIGQSISGDAGYVLTLQSARGSASVRLTSIDLELGVLVGRAPKCSDGLRSVLNDGISRVHLLIRKGIVYDLASTQGTYVASGGGGRRRVRSAHIEGCTEMFIGSASAARLRFTKLPDGGTMQSNV